MTKPVVIDVSINKQGGDRDMRLYVRCYTPNDVSVVQSMIDTYLYDLQADVKEREEAGK